MTRKNDQWYVCTYVPVYAVVHDMYYMKAGKVYDKSEMLELQCSNVQMFVEPVADVGNYCCNAMFLQQPSPESN